MLLLLLMMMMMMMHCEGDCGALQEGETAAGDGQEQVPAA